MIKSPPLNIVIAISMLLALITISIILVVSNNAVKSGIYKSEPTYATQIFGPDIISIEIITDENDWQAMLDNAIAEQFIMADVIVNGTTFKNVGIRPKGNSSLTQVARSESDRYSFRLQFNEYIKAQTCFGLESLVVNNMLSDNTYMKEYIAYDLMKEAGVAAPYFGFADIKINGEAGGLYLAVELYNESYEQRVFGTTLGMLYNVKSMDMGQNASPLNKSQPDFDAGRQPGHQANPTPGEKREEMPPFNPDSSTVDPQTSGNFPSPDNNILKPSGIIDEERRGGMGRAMGGVPGGNSGGSLAYIDDDYTSYSAIFNNVVGKGEPQDYQRVITALQALSAGQDLEKYFNVDQILRYLAAHTLVVNLDSYSSHMAQNYYIYEKDGQITILPWDYNMAWGGFQSPNALSVINFPIDTPVSGVEMSERPLLEKLLGNAEYREIYHSYLQELIDTYFAEGKFAAQVNQIDALINDYVKNDATAFCTYEDYEKAVAGLITLGNLRAQSVQGQLNGTVPSYTAAQAANPEKLIPAGDFELQVLGNMGGGRSIGDGEQRGIPSGGDRTGGNIVNGQDNEKNIPNREEAMQIIRQAGGEITDEVKAKLKELGLTEEQIEQFSAMANTLPIDNRNNNRQANMSLSQKGVPDFNHNQSTYNIQHLQLMGVLAAVLLLATLITAKLKRNY